MYYDAYSDEQRIKALWDAFDEFYQYVTTFNKYYVPKIMGDWNAATAYDVHSIVTDTTGAQYISIQDVPAGIPLTNTDYWTPMGAGDASEAIAIANDAKQTATQAQSTATAAQSAASAAQTAADTAQSTAESAQSAASAASTAAGEAKTAASTAQSTATAAQSAASAAQTAADTAQSGVNELNDVTDKIANVEMFMYGALFFPDTVFDDE